MQDFCLNAANEAAIISALESVGLTTPGMDGKPCPVGNYYYDGRIVAQQGQYRTNPDGTTETIAETTYLPGVYAKYRATDEQAALIQAATLPSGVEIVEPPTGLPLFGGEWLSPKKETLEEAITRVKSEIDEKRDTLLKSGYHFTFENQLLFLQTRDDEDRINWLGVLNAATVMVMSGKGSDLTKIRTGENVTIEIPYSQVQVLMLQTLGYQSSIYEAAWKYKDSLKDMTLEQVLSYDIESGWPI